MKELSIEQKAKAYDEALRKAKEVLDDIVDDYVCTYLTKDDIKGMYANILPELRGSEEDKNERIRKDLIKFIKGCGAYSQEYIDWLEKQGEVSPSEDELEALRIAAYEPYKNWSEKLQSLYMKLSHCEQGEQKPVAKISVSDELYEHIRNTCACIDDTISCNSIKDMKDYLAQARTDANIALDMVKQNLDKIEPKFKDGDWIIHNTYYNLIYYVDSILSPQSNCYCLNSKGGTRLMNFSEQDNYHLWTIQDAKDGDVLATDDGVCIFDGTLEEGKYPFAYCGITIRGFESYNRNLPFSHDNTIHPATKSQRDTLFKAMADAGYIFDFEKKELKKVEQVIDYPDSLPKDNWELVHEFIKKFGRIPKDEDELNVLVEYILKRQKPVEWSEKEQQIIKDAACFILSCVNIAETKKEEEKLEELADKLQDLRPNRWKPSNEQMRALDIAIRCGIQLGSSEEIALRSLLEQLKQL